MLLRPEYRYLFLDFETTGLDLIKDDPIQIGLVLMDHTGTIQYSYTTRLKPAKPIQELKSIVSYLTQTSLQQLQDAPAFEEIMDKITPFLETNTVLIGHNISFDLAFLHRYTDWTPEFTIDTFPLCKACFHFLPSYALEVVAKHLGIDTEQAHDALSDCLINREVFVACIQHLQKIRSTYLIFDYILQNSQTPLASILARTVKNYHFGDKQLFLPPLTRPSQAIKKLVQPQQAMITAEQFGQSKHSTLLASNLQSFLSQIERKKNARLLCFSHKSKIQIADHILSEQGIPTTLLQDTVVFLPDRIDLLLKKGLFDEGELFFLAKYLSHHLQAHTLMDINSSDDYKIFHALTEQKPARHGQVLLATHEQLYQTTHQFDEATQVLFFDTDWWWQTRGNQTNQPIDPHHLLQYLEHASYKALLTKNTQQAEHIEALSKELNLLFGILGGEIDNLFVGYTSNTLEIECLSTHTRLPKSKAILEHFFQKEMFFDNIDEIAVWRKKQYTLLHSLFHQNTIIVNKMMYQGDKRWYTFSAPKGFATFGELQEQLPKASYSYLSVLPKDHASSLGTSTETSSLTILEHIHRPDQVISFLQEATKNIFILSGSKSHAQDLFQQLIRAKKDEQRLIVGENITGGVGKIVYLATQSKKPVIMIGGFGCYLATCAKKFAISTLLAYHCEGKQKPLLLADIHFYRPSG